MLETTGRLTRATTLWTGERIRAVGAAGVVAGIAMTAVAIVHNALDLQHGSRGYSLSSLAHSISYAAMVAVLLGAVFVFGARYGRLGRGLAYSMVIALAAMIPVFPLVDLWFGEDWVVGGVVAGLAFVVLHLVATVFGIVMWRRAPGSRLAAGLFIAVIPAIVIVAVLDGFGVVSLTAAAFEAPLYLGFAALGRDLYQHSPESTPQALG